MGYCRLAFQQLETQSMTCTNTLHTLVSTVGLSNKTFDPHAVCFCWFGTNDWLLSSRMIERALKCFMFHLLVENVWLWCTSSILLLYGDIMCSDKLTCRFLWVTRKIQNYLSFEMFLCSFQETCPLFNMDLWRCNLIM